MYAAKENHPHTCQELLLHGANFGLVNLDDDTALSIATENNSTSGLCCFLMVFNVLTV